MRLLQSGQLFCQPHRSRDHCSSSLWRLSRYPPLSLNFFLEEGPGSADVFALSENSSGSACGCGSRSRFLAALRLNAAPDEEDALSLPHLDFAKGICPQTAGLAEGKWARRGFLYRGLPTLALDYVASIFCAMQLNVCSWDKSLIGSLKHLKKSLNVCHFFLTILKE